MIAIIFSKQRPLQLRAYLESLEFATGLKDIIVIYYEEEDGLYDPLIDQYDHVVWMKENDPNLETTGFEDTLKKVIEIVKADQHNNILFGCDDVIYTRFTNLKAVDSIISDRSIKTLGFSLRLGLNIRNVPALNDVSPIMSWNWVTAQDHWHYCFELMGSVYPIELVEEIMEVGKGKIKTPNYLESIGTTHCWQNKTDINRMFMFKDKGAAVAQDLNLAQSDFLNKHGGAPEQSIEALINAFKDGKRIRWEKLWGISPIDCFVGNKYFELE